MGAGVRVGVGWRDGRGRDGFIFTFTIFLFDIYTED